MHASYVRLPDLAKNLTRITASDGSPDMIAFQGARCALGGTLSAQSRTNPRNLLQAYVCRWVHAVAGIATAWFWMQWASWSRYHG
jgi:hypothetical protein